MPERRVNQRRRRETERKRVARREMRPGRGKLVMIVGAVVGRKTYGLLPF